MHRPMSGYQTAMSNYKLVALPLPFLTDPCNDSSDGCKPLSASSFKPIRYPWAPAPVQQKAYPTQIRQGTQPPQSHPPVTISNMGGQGHATIANMGGNVSIAVASSLLMKPHVIAAANVEAPNSTAPAPPHTLWALKEK